MKRRYLHTSLKQKSQNFQLNAVMYEHYSEWDGGCSFTRGLEKKTSRYTGTCPHCLFTVFSCVVIGGTTMQGKDTSEGWVPGFTKLLLVNSGSRATKTSRCQGNSCTPAWDETAVYRDGLQGPACHRPLRSGTSWFMLRSLPVESFCPPTLDNRQQGRGESKQRLWGRRIEIEEMPQLWQAFVFLAEKVPITETRSSEVTSSLQATGKAYILCRTLGK